MGSTRRTLLAGGAAAAATAAVPRLFAQQASKAGAGKFYEKATFAFTMRRPVPAFR
jgi:hypothetical protein